MKYSFYRRLFEVDILLLIVGLPFLIAYILLAHFDSQVYFLLFKALIAGTCVAFLASSRLFGFLQSKFPSLKRYIIRFILSACCLLMFASWNVAPISDTILGVVLIISLIAGCLLIVLAKLGAVLGI